MKKNILAILCLMIAGVNTAWADKFEIKNLADLVMFRDYVYSGEKDFANDTVIVTADIDASTTVWAYGIGMLKDETASGLDDDSSLYPFKGVFDGQGYTIKGLKIVTENVQQAAFFQCIKGATIKNLNLEDCEITGRGHRVAGIVARAFSDDATTERNTIQNCNVINCTITCTAAVDADFSLIGGIAATVGNTTIEGCAVKGGTINGTTRGGSGELYCNGAGGIVGRLNGTCTVKNCTVYGGTKIYGKVKGVGAIIGEFGGGDAYTVESNTYQTDVEVNYYDTTTGEWWTVDNNGLKWWNTALPGYEVNAAKKYRGFNLPTATDNPSGITEASEDISTATIYLMNGSSEQRWATSDYTNPQKPSSVTVKIGGTTLTQGTDYTVTYENMVEPGIYPYGVKITGMGTYYGYVYADFTVCKSIDPTKTTTITIDPDPIGARVYTGSGLTAEVDVYDGDKQLIEGTDYQLLYTTTDPGDAGYEASFTTTPKIGASTAVTKVTVRIDGLGLYSEKFDKDFYIVPAEREVDNIKYALNDKTNTVNVTGYTGTDVDIVVPAKMKPDATNFASLEFDVTGIKALTNATINSVTLPASIEEIADNAFDGATNLHWINASEATAFVPTTLSRTVAGPFKGVNPRALVFLNGTTVTGTNYVYKVAPGDYQCDVLNIVDDATGSQTGFADLAAASWGFQNPIAFKANTVTNNRKMTATVAVGTETKQQGYTTCLPYDLPISESFKAYSLAYSKTNQVGFNEVTATTLTAMTPYVLIPSASGQFFGATDATVKKTYDAATSKFVEITPNNSEAASGQTLYQLIGTMAFDNTTTGIFIMQKANEWAEIETAGTYNTQCVLPMRAYIKANGTATARMFSVFNDADGSTTVIKGLQIDADATGDIYDLQGRKVAAPQRGGLYIINGKKAVMK